MTAKSRDVPEQEPTAPPSDDDPQDSGKSAKPDSMRKGKVTKKQTDEAKDRSTGKSANKKRNAITEPDVQRKAARRSNRGARRSQPSQRQILDFLLSDNALEICRPEDETADIKARGDIRTYSSSILNPFEELLSAAILSRPISHRLGLRTIRTVLNEPYSFTSARTIKDAGSEKVHEAIWNAKTQHKQKTAEQIIHIADVVLEKFTSADETQGSKLEGVRISVNHDVDQEHTLLRSSIKGIGKTGMAIFFRRVQWLWEEAYPYIDDRTANALRKLGLPDGAEELRGAIDEHWKQLGTNHLAGEVEAAKKRRALVVVLERATGADLEGRIDALTEAASAAV